jgi:hypothetical protein
VAQAKLKMEFAKNLPRGPFCWIKWLAARAFLLSLMIDCLI